MFNEGVRKRIGKFFGRYGRLFSLLLLLLLAGTLAITQESSADEIEDTEDEDLLQMEYDPTAEQLPEIPSRPLPEWAHPVRWFRSNAGGMTLEEIPSRLAALRNEYALSIDFADPAELPEILLSHYLEQYYIEVRILYENGTESRRQWIFRDENGNNRLVAVINEIQADEDAAAADAVESEDYSDELLISEIDEDNPDAILVSEEDEDNTVDVLISEENEDNEAEDNQTVISLNEDREPHRSISGFIEVYNEKNLLTLDRLFYEDGEERDTEYFYRSDTLVRAETIARTFEDGNETAVKLYTDTYRYNRSNSMRSLERIYHENLDNEAVRLSFPNRVLDAAAEKNFINDQLYLGPEFFGSFSVEAGQRTIMTTDDRGRVLTQSLLDEEDNVIWMIQNTWSGERVVSSVKTQGDDELRNEYEYSDGGDRIVERNYNNGILERQVLTVDGRETEELFIRGVVALRAIWEDGRKISEERIQRGEREQ